MPRAVSNSARCSKCGHQQRCSVRCTEVAPDRKLPRKRQMRRSCLEQYGPRPVAEMRRAARRVVVSGDLPSTSTSKPSRKAPSPLASARNVRRLSGHGQASMAAASVSSAPPGWRSVGPRVASLELIGEEQRAGGGHRCRSASKGRPVRTRPILVVRTSRAALYGAWSLEDLAQRRGRGQPARPTSLRAMATRSVLWTAIGKGSNAVISLGVTASVLTRLLTPADFGIVAMVVTISGFFNIMAEAGVKHRGREEATSTSARSPSLTSGWGWAWPGLDGVLRPSPPASAGRGCSPSRSSHLVVAPLSLGFLFLALGRILNGLLERPFAFASWRRWSPLRPS